MCNPLAAHAYAVSNLNCVSKNTDLIAVRHRFDLDEENFDVLKTHLSALVDDNVDQVCRSLRIPC